MQILVRRRVCWWTPKVTRKNPCSICWFPFWSGLNFLIILNSFWDFLIKLVFSKTKEFILKKSRYICVYSSWFNNTSRSLYTPFQIGLFSPGTVMMRPISPFREQTMANIVVITSPPDDGHGISKIRCRLIPTFVLMAKDFNSMTHSPLQGLRGKICANG